MLFEINHNKATDTFGAIKDGVYEVFVSSVREEETKSGRTSIQAVLTVRNDVEQPFQNALIFHNVWSPKDTNKLTEANYQTIAKQLGIPNGTKIESMDDFWKAMQFNTLKVTVKTSTSGQYTNVNVVRFEPSTNTLLNHVNKQGDKVAEANLPVDVSIDSLPF